MQNDPKYLSELAKQTQHVYERNAKAWFDHRPKSLLEKKWLDKFLSILPEGGRILDIGCGTGIPIAQYFVTQGKQIIGIDASKQMIEAAQQNLPDFEWRLMDMRKLSLNETFAGIIGWGSFFHLTMDEQRQLLPVLAQHLNPGGVLLLTVGPTGGEVAGRVGNEAIYHASLDTREYRQILSENFMSVRAFVPQDPECFDMTLLLAQKT